MEIWAILAVGIFTVIGAIVGSTIPHLLQQRALAKQRKWVLEDEARKTKRELVNKRLGIVEEIIGLMVRVLDDAIEEVIGIQSRDKSGNIEQAKNRIGMISSDSWTAVLLTGSDKLKESYGVISQMYWDMLEHNDVPQHQGGWDKIKDAQIAAIEIIDNMRALGK